MKQAIADQSAPAFRGTIAVGRRYRLRNGAIVTITGYYSATILGMFFWIAQYADGAKCTLQRDGWRAPECGVRPHELDIVGTAP